MIEEALNAPSPEEIDKKAAKLFAELSEHPDNVPMDLTRWLVTKLMRSEADRRARRALAEEIKALHQANHELVEWVCKQARKATEAVEKYRRGPQAKKKQHKDLLDAMRLALAHGTPRKPAQILKALEKREDADALIFRTRKGQRKRLSPKTIANKLREIE
jgi:hypothetical protein